MPRKQVSLPETRQRNSVGENAPLTSLEDKRTLQKVDSLINRAKNIINLAKEQTNPAHVESHINQAEEFLNKAEELKANLDGEVLKGINERMRLAYELIETERSSLERRAA